MICDTICICVSLTCFPKSSFTRKHSPHKQHSHLKPFWPVFMCISSWFFFTFEWPHSFHWYLASLYLEVFPQCVNWQILSNKHHISSLGPICSSSKSLYLSSKSNFLQLGSMIGDKPNQEKYILFLDRLSKNVTWPKFSLS